MTYLLSAAQNRTLMFEAEAENIDPHHIHCTSLEEEMEPILSP